MIWLAAMICAVAFGILLGAVALMVMSHRREAAETVAQVRDRHVKTIHVPFTIMKE